MAIRGSAPLGNAQGFNGSSFIGSSAGQAQFWDGGRSAVVIQAAAGGQYGTINLQMQGLSGTWMNIASSFVADQLYVFDAVPAQYRLTNQSGSSIGIFAALLPVQYNL